MARLLCFFALAALAACGGDDDAPADDDAGRGTDAGPVAMDDGATPPTDAGRVADTIPDVGCTNLSGVFRVLVDGNPHGPWPVRLDPRDATNTDWDIISCDTSGNLTAFLHFIFPEGASRPLSTVELPQEVAAIDPVAEGFFNGSLMSDEMPADWPRQVLGFRPALSGGPESVLRIDTFDDTTLIGSLDSEASGGARIHIDFNLAID